MVFLLLFSKGTYLRPQPAQPVGGPLRAFQCEGRRPGNQREVQPPPTQPHQRRGSRGRNLLPRGFFPPFLPKKWGPGWASQGSLPFQRRWRRPRNAPPPGQPPSQRRWEFKALQSAPSARPAAPPGAPAAPLPHGGTGFPSHSPRQCPRRRRRPPRGRSPGTPSPPR